MSATALFLLALAGVLLFVIAPLVGLEDWGEDRWSGVVTLLGGALFVVGLIAGFLVLAAEAAAVGATWLVWPLRLIPAALALVCAWVTWRSRTRATPPDSAT